MTAPKVANEGYDFPDREARETDQWDDFPGGPSDDPPASGATAPADYTPTQFDRLIQEHQADVDTLRDLWAQYGPGATWDHDRKATLDSIALRIRTEAQAAGRKITDGAIDEAAHADPAYHEYLKAVRAGRAEYIVQHWKVWHGSRRIDALTAGRYA